MSFILAQVSVVVPKNQFTLSINYQITLTNSLLDFSVLYTTKQQHKAPQTILIIVASFFYNFTFTTGEPGIITRVSTNLQYNICIRSPFSTVNNLVLRGLNGTCW